VAHLARDACSDDPFLTKVLGMMLGLQLCFNGFETAVEVINLSIKGMVLVDLCNEVPLIQIVNSHMEDRVAGLGAPEHMSELEWQGLEGLITGASRIRQSIKVNSVGGVHSILCKPLDLSIR
jgi:hypothetical protein